MSVTADDLIIKFNGDATEAQRGIDRMSEKVKGLGSALGSALETAERFCLGRDESPPDEDKPNDAEQP